MLQKTTPFLAAIFIAIFAQLSITLPLNETNIPITGQTFAVLLVASILGRNKGSLAILIYLIMGTIGLPVFAKAASGYQTFFKGSGGFLYGFLIAAFVVGWLSDKGWGTTILNALLLMLIGTIIIVFFGLIQLTFLYGFEKALEYGFYPFIRGAIIKIVLGALALQAYYSFMKTRK